MVLQHLSRSLKNLLDLSLYEHTLGAVDHPREWGVLVVLVHHIGHRQIDVLLGSGNIAVSHDPLEAEGVATVGDERLTKAVTQAVRAQFWAGDTRPGFIE